MKKKILIIDDDKSMRMLLSHVLEHNYVVYSIKSAKEAIGWMHQGNLPDLIITDANMPEMDGIDFVDYIKGSLLFSRIPIIILSSLEKSSDRLQFYNRGVDQFIGKPFDPSELESRISYLLAS